MTAIQPDVPVPAGAVVGGWFFLNSGQPEEAYRRLVWARFDTAGIIVAVAGAQYGDGRVERFIEVDDSLELDAGTARQLASALLDAAKLQ